MRTWPVYALVLSCAAPSLAAERVQGYDLAKDALSRAHRRLMGPEGLAYELPAQDASADGDLSRFECRFVYGWGHGHNLHLVSIGMAHGDLEIVRFGMRCLYPKHEKYPGNTVDARLESASAERDSFVRVLRALRCAQRTKVTKVIREPTRVVNADGTITVSGRFFSMSSSNFVVSLKYGSNGAVQYEHRFCGYPSSSTEADHFLAVAMRGILFDYLGALDWVEVESLSEHHRGLFDSHFRDLMGEFDRPRGWWWVRERMLKLASVYGSEALTPHILRLLSHSHERTRHQAATALAGITGVDFRFDGEGKALPVERTTALYRERFADEAFPPEPRTEPASGSSF